MDRETARTFLVRYADKNIDQYESTLAYVQACGEAGIKPGQLERDRQIVKTGFLCSGASDAAVEKLLVLKEQYVPVDAEFVFYLLQQGAIREKLMTSVQVKRAYCENRDKDIALAGLREIGFQGTAEENAKVLAILDHINTIETEYRKAFDIVVGEMLQSQLPDANLN